MRLPKYRFVAASALAAVVVSLLLVWVTRRHRHRSATVPSSADLLATSGADSVHRPREPGAVRVGPPAMIHLDPRHTNRSPWMGPTRAALAWTFDVGGAIEAAPAVLDNGTIVVGTLSGRLVGLAPDGTQRFSVELGERIYSSPMVSQGGIFVGTDKGRFLGLHANGGAARWKLETDGDADTGPTWTPWGGVVFASGKILYAAKLDGTLLWRVKARRKIYSSPAIADDGTVFVGSQDDHVYAVAPDGKVRWRVSLGADVDSAPAIADDGTVFVGTDKGEVVALSPGDGKVQWRHKTGGFVRGALSITRDGTVLAGTYGPRPRLVGLWPDDGAERFEFAIHGTGAAEFGIHGAPVEDGQGRLYFGAQDDFVYALGADRKLLWKFKTTGDVDAPLVITPEGVLLAGSDDGKLYAFRETFQQSGNAPSANEPGSSPAGSAAGASLGPSTSAGTVSPAMAQAGLTLATMADAAVFAPKLEPSGTEPLPRPAVAGPATSSSASGAIGGAPALSSPSSPGGPEGTAATLSSGSSVATEPPGSTSAAPISPTTTGP